MSVNRRVVVTGGPGAGKTTLLAALMAKGYPCVPDSARAVIADRMRRGLSARPEPPQFAWEILRADIDRYREAPAERLVFFDRGIPDALGMLHELGLLTPADAGRYLSEFAYGRRVLVLPPWERIYTNDAERDQTFCEAVRVHGACCEWYLRCGFELVEVPQGPVEERCDFVLRNVADLAAS